MAESANKDTGETKPRKVKYRKTKASWNPAMQAILVLHLLSTDIN